MSLSFNAPVRRRMAEGIRLKSDKDSFKPAFDREDRDCKEGDATVTAARPHG